MKSSWIAGAAPAPPPTPGSFSNGYPTDGNPGTATPPTEPGAWWFYMVTQEIVNAITAASLTPSATTLNQLTAAINALAAAAAPVQSVNTRTGAVTGVVDTANFTGGNQSLGASGYQKLPGGLILQWGVSGSFSGDSAGNVVTFPITFPNACFVVAATPSTDNGVSAGQGYSAGIFNKTASQFKINNDSTGTTFDWVAIGN